MWCTKSFVLLLLFTTNCSGDDHEEYGIRCVPATLTVPRAYKALNEVSAKWADMGRLLNIPQNRLDVIRQDCPTVDCCYSKMLQMWYDMHGSVSWYELVDALEYMHHTRLATRIQQEYLCADEHEPTVHDLNHPIIVSTNGMSSNEELMEVLEDSFQDLVCAAVRSLSKTVNLAEFRQRLINLPVSLKIEHKQFFTKEIISYITKAESIEEVFGYLSLYWNFLNCDLLNYIVKKFGDVNLVTLMREYMLKLDGFRRNINLKEFLSMWPNDMDPPPGFTHYTLKLPHSPHEMTLQDIDNFRKQHAKNYSLQSYALILGSLEEGSILLTFFVSRNCIGFIMQGNVLNAIPGIIYAVLDHCILLDSVHKVCQCTRWDAVKSISECRKSKPFRGTDVRLCRRTESTLDAIATYSNAIGTVAVTLLFCIFCVYKVLIAFLLKLFTGVFFRQIAKLQQLENTIKEKDDVIAEKQEEIQHLNIQIQQSNRENLLKLQSKDILFTDKAAAFESLNTAFQKNHQLLLDCRKEILRKDEKLQLLQHHITTRESEIKELVTQCKFLKKQVEQLEDRRKASDAKHDTITLQWRKGDNAPCQMHLGSCVVEGNVAYFRDDWSNHLYAFHSSVREWIKLPDCPRDHYSLVVINSRLTAVGGLDSDEHDTDTLLSLIAEESDDEMKWLECLPPMPTKCCNAAAAVCNGSTLIVVGGVVYDSNHDIQLAIKAVEVLDITYKQWFKATNLPYPIWDASACICGSKLFVAGGYDDNNWAIDSVLSCEISVLTNFLQPTTHTVCASAEIENVWHEIENLSAYNATSVSFNGQLIAVGGNDGIPTNAIYAYDPIRDYWNIISRMPTSRDHCLVAVLSDNEVMVVGGVVDEGILDVVEFGSIP